MDFYKEHNEMWKLWENLGVNPILRNTQNKVNTELFWFFFFSSSYQELVQKNIKFPWSLKKIITVMT